MVAGHGEHRMLMTRALDLSIIELNGRWEPLLQMTVNVFIHAAFACGLATCLWHFLGRKNGWLVCVLLAPFFALPYAGENATQGFSSLYYFVSIFALATIAGLAFGKTGGWLWWIGCATAVLGLFTMASGLLGPVAAGGLIVLRAIKNRRLEKGNLLSLGVCVVVAVLGVALSRRADYNAELQAHSFTEYTTALSHNFAWPFINAPAMPCLIGLPLAVLLVLYLRPNFGPTRAGEFLLALALWSALQSMVIAYGRANYGDGIPASRYMDLLNVFVIASVFAVVLLAQSWERYQLPGGILALAFVGIILYGLCRISQIAVEGLIAPTRMWNLVAEERVQRFETTGNKSDLFERPTVRPDPGVAWSVLIDTNMQTILPASCLPPAYVPTPERLAPLSQWLLKQSIVILSAGLVLFIGLCGYGLARGKMGLTARNPAGIVALLVGLAALGFVWSKRNMTRESVEYQLQQQIANNFKAAGNLKRAAIHEQKAEQLKQFAN